MRFVLTLFLVIFAVFLSNIYESMASDGSKQQAIVKSLIRSDGSVPELHSDGFASVVVGIRISSDDNIDRADRMGVMWRQFDPSSGSLRPREISPYLFRLELIHDPDCNYLNCPADRLVTVRYFLPLGHYVLSNVFFTGYNDMSGVQIYSLLRKDESALSGRLPVVKLANKEDIVYVGDISFSAKFAKKQKEKRGILNLEFENTVYDLSVLKIEDDLPRLESTLADIRVGNLSSIGKKLVK